MSKESNSTSNSTWNQATSMNLPNTLISINNYDYNWLKIQKVGLFVKQRTKL